MKVAVQCHLRYRPRPDIPEHFECIVCHLGLNGLRQAIGHLDWKKHIMRARYWYALPCVLQTWAAAAAALRQIRMAMEKREADDLDVVIMDAIVASGILVTKKASTDGLRPCMTSTD